MEFIVHVVDQNDNKPVFTQVHFLGIVSDASKIGNFNKALNTVNYLYVFQSVQVFTIFFILPFTLGFEFLTISATDADDPNTDNADIRYSIISQAPPEPNPNMFEIDPIRGAIRVNAEGLDSKVKT